MKTISKLILAMALLVSLVALPAFGQSEPNHYGYYAGYTVTGTNAYVPALSTNSTTGILINCRKFENIWIQVLAKATNYDNIGTGPMIIRFIPSGDGTSYKWSGVTNSTAAAAFFDVSVPSSVTNITVALTNFTVPFGYLKGHIINNSTSDWSNVAIKWGGRVPLR